MKFLTDKARELGVQTLLKTPVKKILKEGAQIVGVMAEDETGEEIQANAKAVSWLSKLLGNPPPVSPSLVRKGDSIF